MNFEIKVYFEIKMNFEIKVYFEIKMNFEIKVNFEIKMNFEIKVNFEIKMNFEIKVNFEIKMNFEIKVNFEIKINFEIKVKTIRGASVAPHGSSSTKLVKNRRKMQRMSTYPAVIRNANTYPRPRYGAFFGRSAKSWRRTTDRPVKNTTSRMSEIYFSIYTERMDVFTDKRLSFTFPVVPSPLFCRTIREELPTHHGSSY
ncbi:unnamed protein product [Nesidiocoris tenuis]|uniref:Uncharacterized protein n=1 Tax=Nesidiocoris tenuis TaxID=355587 RepID=A0A6H5GDK8_9HEMI|nr:unnamed protein product [Nesidiocoris tenuis]